MIYGSCKGLAASFRVAAVSPPDQFLPGAFSNIEVPQYGVPLFWFHSGDEPDKVVGRVTSYRESARGLECEMIITSQQVWNSIVENCARSLSVGWITDKRKMKFLEDVRIMSEMTIWKELTILPNGYGADPDAWIETIIPAVPMVAQAAPARAIAEKPSAPLNQPPTAQPAITTPNPHALQAVRDQIYMHERIAAMYRPK